MTANSSIPVDLEDEINAAILAVSEDRLAGFQLDPISEIAARCELPAGLVIERLQALLDAVTIRRIRQTVQATKLASGALVAWKVPPEKLDAAFEFLVRQDPALYDRTRRLRRRRGAGCPDPICQRGPRSRPGAHVPG